MGEVKSKYILKSSHAIVLTLLRIYFTRIFTRLNYCSLYMLQRISSLQKRNVSLAWVGICLEIWLSCTTFNNKKAMISRDDKPLQRELQEGIVKCWKRL